MNGVENLLALYNQATAEELERGVKWYKEVYDTVSILADNIIAQGGYHDLGKNVLIERIAGVVAVMSPRMPWHRNMDVAWQIVLCIINNEKLTDLKVGLLGNTMKGALIFITGEFELLGEQKVYKFWRNIVDAGKITEHVTVDTWAWRAFHMTNKTNKGIPPDEYLEIENAYREASEKVGLAPHVFQAVVWEVVRNNPDFKPV